MHYDYRLISFTEYLLSFFISLRMIHLLKVSLVSSAKLRSANARALSLLLAGMQTVALNYLLVPKSYTFSLAISIVRLLKLTLPSCV
jgi:hypothetical protein